MSHSSAGVRYRPKGAGHRPRRAVFDLTLIRDPEAWLTRRLGPLATCEVERVPEMPAQAAAKSPDGRIAAASARLSTAPSPTVSAIMRTRSRHWLDGSPLSAVRSPFPQTIRHR